MRFTLRNLLDNLDTRWKIKIFHSAKNAEWLEDLLKKDFSNERDRLLLENLGTSIETKDQYNTMMKTKEFYAKIPTEVFLVAQTDSMICPPHKGLLEKFMKYDYVGAPWDNGSGVGNGGFSLRRKTKMLEILEKCTFQSHMHEDAIFSHGCDAAKASKPTAEEAKEFSQETMFSEKSFGIHKPWAHLHGKLREIEQQCPGMEQLRQLQGSE